jgi:hypothetical protein
VSPLGWSLGARSSTPESSFFGIGAMPGPRFFRNQHTIIYYSKVVRKELLRPPISDAERRRILALLRTMRLINPDPQNVAAYSDLLERYPYLRESRRRTDRSVWLGQESSDRYCESSPL